VNRSDSRQSIYGARRTSYNYQRDKFGNNQVKVTSAVYDSVATMTTEHLIELIVSLVCIYGFFICAEILGILLKIIWHHLRKLGVQPNCVYFRLGVVGAGIAGLLAFFSGAMLAAHYFSTM
jgi:hypothetical protein